MVLKQIMMVGPTNHGLLGHLLETAAAKIRNLVLLAGTSLDLFLETPNVLELVETVPE